jgi:outer membrane protein assembly factor BamB
MKSSRVLRRWVSLIATCGVFALVLGVVAWQKGQESAVAGTARDAAKKDDVHSWPLFGGSVARDLVNLVDKDIPITWDNRKASLKNIKWSVPLGSKAYGGPIVSGGKIFIGTNNNHPRDPAIKGDKGVLMCFREPVGEFLWQSVTDKLPAGRVNDWPEEGICSSPVVEGDRLWYVSNRCEVICATTEGLGAGNRGPFTQEKYKGPKNIDIIWKLDMIGKLNVFPHNLATCSPLIVGDVLFVITSNGVDEGHINIPSPAAPSFLAIDKNTGEVLWSDNSPTRQLVEARAAGKEVEIKQLVNQGRLLMHGQWSNPVYAEPNGKPMIIFPGGDGWIRAFNPKNGELLWKFDCNPKDTVYVLGPDATRNDFVSTPVVWQNKLYIGVGQDPEHKKGVGHLWCIDITKEPKSAEKDLTPANNNFDPKAEVNKDSGLVWHYGGEAPENDEERQWVFGRTLSTCSVHDGLCYEAEYDGWIHCLDANTGKRYWRHSLGADTWSSPYWVDGKVYIGNENGKVLIFGHGKEKKIVGQVQMQGKVRATPVAVNGTLYVITENPCMLWAIAAK